MARETWIRLIYAEIWTDALVANVSLSMGLVKRGGKADCDSNGTYSFNENHATSVVVETNFVLNAYFQGSRTPELIFSFNKTQLQFRLIGPGSTMGLQS